MFECPDYFKLGEKDVVSWSVVDTLPASFDYQDIYQNTQAAVWSAGKLHPDTASFIGEWIREIDKGPDFYAPQTLSSPDGRTIMIGWMQSWNRSMPTHELSHGWAGQMTIPRELYWLGNSIAQRPVRELERYRGTLVERNEAIAGRRSLPGISGQRPQLGHCTNTKCHAQCSQIWYHGAMDILVFLSWIAAYTLVLLNIGVFAWCAALSKDRRDISFLLVLINMALVTATVMALVVLRVPWGRTFQAVLLNALSIYYFTVPWFIVGLNPDIRIGAGRLSVLALTLCALDNLAVFFGQGLWALFLFWLPFFIFFAYLRRKARASIGRAYPSLSHFWTSVEGVGAACVSLMASLTVIDGVAMLAGAGRWQYFQPLFFSIFTAAYQVPGLLYCAHTLRLNRAKREMARIANRPPDLSPREWEVAQALATGLTYQQVADKLFISLSAVKKHVANIYRKTGARNGRELSYRLSIGGKSVSSEEK